MEEEIDKCDDVPDNESVQNEDEISIQFKEEFERFSGLLTDESSFSLTPLENLGNSCYMNSILICLSHNLDLTEYFLSENYISDINIKGDNNLSNLLYNIEGKLANTYYKLMTDLWLNSMNAVPTTEIKSVISKVFKQFTGVSQHDAHEFLICLLDGMNDDVNKINKKIIKEIGGKKVTETELEALKRIEDSYLLRNSSIITQLFQGYYKNTISCPECQFTSINFEPFITVELPINTVKKVEVFIIPNNEFKEKICLSIFVPEEALFSELPVFINRFLKEKLNTRRFLLVKSNESVKLIKNNEKIFDTSLKGWIFCIEMNQKTKEEFFPAITLVKDLNKPKELLSFPRIFSLNSEMKIRELKLSLFRFMRRYIKIKDLDMYEKIELNNINLDEIITRTVEKEYDLIFSQKSEKFADFKINFPFDAILLHKDSTKSVILGSSINDKFRDEDTIKEILLQLKGGSKLVIELIRYNEYTNLDEINKINNCVRISPKDANKPTNLFDLMNLFYLNERLDKANEWFCETCNKFQNAFKRIEIFKAPKYLVFQLKRFSIINKKPEKNREMVEFPINNLNLFKYINPIINTNSIYELYGLTLHSGSTEGGHYTAIVRNIEGWQEFNDSSVYPVDKESILSEDVYLLFYKQIK